jgi:hypothetical protein
VDPLMRQTDHIGRDALEQPGRPYRVDRIQSQRGSGRGDTNRTPSWGSYR